MRHHYAIVSLVACVLIGLLAGRSLVQSDSAKLDLATPSKTAIQVMDYAGNSIQLQQAATRVIALAPHIVENVYSAGAGHTLVGAVPYSNYPQQANSLPHVGGFDTLNYEEIVRLAPDLIIAWQSGHNHSNIKRLKELGFTVYVDNPRQLSDVAKSINDIGALTGTTETAQASALQFTQQLNALKQQYLKQSVLSVFYQAWDRPLYTINGNHVISDSIRLCGGHNIYSDEVAVAPVINIESILEKNPDVIIASGMGESSPKWLTAWNKWPQLTAVKQNNLLFVEPDHIQRHTVRILLGIRSLCEQLMRIREQQS